MSSFLEPLAGLNAFVVAPDCPTRAWTDADTDRAVMALLENLGQPLDSFGRIPTYVIHSRSDEVVPIGPDQRATQELEKLGRPVEVRSGQRRRALRHV